MAMQQLPSQLTNLQPIGLHSFNSELDNKPGALIVANNVVQDAPSVVSPRRGFKVYSSGSFGSPVKHLYEYNGNILIHSSTTLYYDNGSGTFIPFTGTFTEPTVGLRMKSLAAKGNFYWSTSTGVVKLSVNPSTSISTTPTIVNAGGIQALDLSATPNFSGSGFLPGNSKVAYRLIWGTRDNNNNVILGAPSNSITVTNTSGSACYTTLNFIVPSNVTTNHFFQIYRSPVVTVAGNTTLATITPSDELQLVAEVYATSANITSKSVSYSDIITESLRATGAYLYTNSISGTGIQSAKTPPPQCQDMALYQQVAFYANTTSAHTLTNNLLSVNKFTSGRTQMVISSGTNATTVNKYTLYGQAQVTQITTVADVGNSLNGTYFLFSNNDNSRNYLVWIKTSGGTTLQPTGSDTLGRIPIQVSITTNDTAATIATAISTALNNSAYTTDFTTTVASTIVTIQNNSNGTSTATANGLLSTGFTIVQAYAGAGGDVTKQRVTLSSLNSTSQQIFETSQSYSKAINSNTNETIYSYYNSSSTSLPGSFTFTSQSVNTNPFYLGVNVDDLSITSNFYSSYAPIVKIGSIGTGTTPTITMPQVALVSTGNNIDTTTGTISAYLGANGLQASGSITSGNVNTGTGVFTLNSHGFNQDQELFCINPTGTLFTGMPTASIVNTNISTTTGVITANVPHNLTNNTLVRFLAGTTLPRFISAACASCTSNVITTSTSHTFRAGDVVVFETGGGPPAQITAGQEYFVLNPTSTTFQISSTPGGTAITLTNTAFTTQVSISQYYVTNVTYNTFTLSRTPSGATLIPSGQGTGTFTLRQVQFFCQYLTANTFSLSTARSGSVMTIASAGSGTHALYPVLSLYNNQPIQVATSSVLPSGLATSTTYYIQNLTYNSFQLSTSINGTTAAIASQGTGTQTYKVMHGYTSGGKVIIFGSNSTASIDGVQTITVIDNFSFSITLQSALSVGGTFGNIYYGSLFSTNQSTPNRLYYSNVSEPEAVPLLNYFDVGDKSASIRRIIPLSTALFIFTDQGIYRLSGTDPTNFTIYFFDSAKVIGPDSIAVVNNQIYCLSAQGVITVSEGGPRILSRPIENLILQVMAPAYTTIAASTFGLGYEQDRSYLLWVPSSATTANASTCYRYNILTDTWTAWPISKISGVVSKNSVLYLSPSDINAVEVERKSLDRTDYADREYSTESFLSGGATYNSSTALYGINVTQVGQIASGDVLGQTVYLTRSRYNQLLLKLANDNLLVSVGSPSITGISLSSGTKYTFTTSATHKFVVGDYIKVSTNLTQITSYVVLAVTSNTFTIDLGSNQAYTSGFATFDWYNTLYQYQFGSLFNALTNLVTKLNLYDTVGGYTYSGSSDPATCQTQYNGIITRLNSSNSVTQHDYISSTGSENLEILVNSTSTSLVQVYTANIADMWMGSFTIYKAITSTVQFAPVHGGNPNTVKHFRMIQPLFERATVKTATIGMKTDLDFGIEYVTYAANLGQWGYSSWGNFVWGGGGSATSPRTLVPRKKQRARYLYIQFSHSVARSTYRLIGFSINVDGEGQSSYPTGL